MAVNTAFRPTLSRGHATRSLKRPFSVDSWLAPVIQRPMALVEISVAMTLILVLSWVARPADPLLLEAEFPWLWIPVTLFALRYGALLGMVAGLFIVGAWAVLYRAVPEMAFPIMMFAGGFIQVIIAGHFADVWHGRKKHAYLQNDYLKQRLAALTTNHYLLRASHDRLQKETFFRTTTLRDSLGDIRRLCHAANKAEALPGTQSLLQFLADACQISSASIHVVEDDVVFHTPVASIGDSGPLEAGNLLLQRCLHNRKLCHVGSDPDSQQTYLACVPIVTPSGRMVAVVEVRDMTFEALNASNLELLLTLLAYYGSALDDRGFSEGIQSIFSSCPEEFATELGRLAQLARHHGMPSYLMGIRVSGALDNSSLEKRIAEVEAEGAAVWKRESVRDCTYIVLHPLVTDVDGLKAEWLASLGDTDGHWRLMAVDPGLKDHGLSNVIFGIERNE